MSRQRNGHRHHHGSSRRKQKRKMMLVCTLAVAFVVCLLGFAVKQKLDRQKSYHVSGSNSIDVGAGYRYTEYNGKKYQYNNRVTTLLYAGLDTYDELKQTATYGDKARADSIMLIVLDEVSKKISVVAINRDTMTEVHRFSRNGNDLGTYVTHIGYAYANGDGGNASCENLKTAVSSLIGGLPISGYIVSNLNSIAMINDLVGGVTVTVPNDDLASKYPELTAGSIVTLDESNVRAYVQQRDTEVDFSNEGRIERQKSFVLSFMDSFGKLVKENSTQVWDKRRKAATGCRPTLLKTDIYPWQMHSARQSLTPDGYYILEGEDQQENFTMSSTTMRMHFQELIIKLFYREV